MEVAEGVHRQAPNLSLIPNIMAAESRVSSKDIGPDSEPIPSTYHPNNQSSEKLHNEELRNLYSSPSIIRMLKSRSMRWVEHVARRGRREMHIKY
jgi:hypothetical protein